MADVQLLLQLSGIILLVPAILFLVFYIYCSKDYGYWKKKGVPEVPPSFIVGSLGWDWEEIQGKQEERWYKQHGKVFGIYEGPTPALMVVDPELLKNILVKDFGVFPNLRSIRLGNPILDRMLFNQDGEHWKELRTTMSPTFTSGKMRVMAHLINECAQKMVENYLENDKKEVDITRYFGAFTMDVIAKCAFGMKLDSRKDPDNPFVKHARGVLSGVPWRFFLAIMMPGLCKLIKLSVLEPKTLQFFEDAVRQVMKSRNNMSKESRPQDFIQLLLNAKDDNENGHKLDTYDIIGNCILFFIAGYFTTAATISMTIHALAHHPKCQERLIGEIDETAKNNKEFDFDTVAGMKYLDAVLSEVLRIQTPAPRIERKAVEDYKLGDTGITIPKGMMVIVPTYAMHHDPQYFPNPEIFDPDRFLPENRDMIKPYTYMPFSTGPRNCLGMRFAVMEIKICIIQALLHVRFIPGPSSTVNIKYHKGRGLHRPEYIYLNVERRLDTKSS